MMRPTRRAAYRRSLPLIFTVLLALPASTAFAQSSATDAVLGELREELARLRRDMGVLQAELATLKGERPVVVPPDAASETPAVDAAAIDMVRSQVEELAQSRLESSSRLPVRFSATVVMNTFANSAEANWLENPNLVAAPPSGLGDTGSMSATARQSRLGFEVGAIPVGREWQARGALIVDFFGGVPNFQNGTVMGLPRLLYAFGRLEHGSTTIQAGQDHVILAPRDPTSLAAFSFPLLFRSGNLYLRAPDVRVEQKVGAVTVTSGIVAPLAGDFLDDYEFAPAAGAGERSHRPAFQTRVAYARGDGDSAREVGLGVSGHYGWRRVAADRLDNSWAVALDGTVRLGRLGVAGELFTARNAEVFGGGSSQPGEARGGWIEGRFAVNRRADVNAGVGLDRSGDAVGRQLLRRENRSVFGNVIVRLTPEVSTSVEYRWLETVGGVVDVRRANHHVNAVFAVTF